MTEAEMAQIDALCLPGESRAAMVRRLLAGVTYAAELARVGLDERERKLPRPDDPRAFAAHGAVAIVYPLGLGSGSGIGRAVLDAPTGAVVHKLADPVASGPVTDAARAEILLDALVRMGLPEAEAVRICGAVMMLLPPAP
jgi:hypothetical protein